MNDPLESRRKDPILREAIESIQSEIAKITHKKQLYELVLTKLGELSSSPYSFVLELSKDKEKQDHLLCNHFILTPNLGNHQPDCSYFELPLNA